jgi:hypothetical protein
MRVNSIQASPSPLGNLVRELLLNGLLSKCDPTLPRLSYLSAQVGVITKAIRRARNDELVPFPTPKGRSDFLVAAHRYLAAIADHEELIAAFGRCLGTHTNAASRLTHIWRGVGDRGSVRFTPHLIELINDQLNLTNGEVLLVHNHPDHALKSVLNHFELWRPIPSSQDRNTAMIHNIDVLQRQLSRRSIAKVRWFLVDEGELAEFRLPSIECMASVLRSAKEG